MSCTASILIILDGHVLHHDVDGVETVSVAEDGHVPGVVAQAGVHDTGVLDRPHEVITQIGHIE